jgi:carboxylesterase type B
MRDDGAAFTAFSKSPNASQALTEQGYNAPRILGSGDFPLPRASLNTTLNIFNLTARVSTDFSFRCPTQATAFSAAANNVFKVYSYEMTRSYQLTRYSPNGGVFDAPKSASDPLGDPTLPYYRCHSGDLYLVFGNFIREGRQPRDKDDVPFSQYIMDSWAAFGRTKNPNPALGFLGARGFANTTAWITTPWKPVKASQPRLRVLDMKTGDAGFGELRQCNVLDIPLDYYSA